MSTTLFGGIEAGGTKFICAVAAEPDKILAQIEIPTTSPQATIEQVTAFFAAQPPISGLGLACFGPLELDPGSEHYGYITSTPKPGWDNFAIIAQLSQALKVPIRFDTDVNTAALGELYYGAGKGLPSVTYMTVGTGIGIGKADKIKTNLMREHSEGGHMLIPRLKGDAAFKSVCPYHDTCLEGLASGTALQQRRNLPGNQIPADDPVWTTEASYLALGIVNTILTCMPKRIVIGGGVMNQTALLPMIRSEVVRLLNGYSVGSTLEKKIDTYLVAPELGHLSGVTGAIELAR